MGEKKKWIKRNIKQKKMVEYCTRPTIFNCIPPLTLTPGDVLSYIRFIVSSYNFKHPVIFSPTPPSAYPLLTSASIAWHWIWPNHLKPMLPHLLFKCHPNLLLNIVSNPIRNCLASLQQFPIPRKLNKLTSYNDMLVLISCRWAVNYLVPCILAC